MAVDDFFLYYYIFQWDNTMLSLNMWKHVKSLQDSNAALFMGEIEGW